MTSATWQVRSISVIPFALVLGGICGLVALLSSIVILVVAMAAVTQQSAIGDPWEVFDTVSYMFVAPFLSCIVGFVSGVAIAVVYNLMASITGGISIELGRADERT